MSGRHPWPPPHRFTPPGASAGWSEVLRIKAAPLRFRPPVGYYYAILAWSRGWHTGSHAPANRRSLALPD